MLLLLDAQTLQNIIFLDNAKWSKILKVYDVIFFRIN